MGAASDQGKDIEVKPRDFSASSGDEEIDLEEPGRGNSKESKDCVPYETDNVVLTIEEGIELAGFGLFQKRLFFVCGLVFMSDAMEIMLLSFLQVLVKAEWNLSTTQEASITSVVFLGELPGAVFWGILGDKLGRKTAFLCSAVLVALFGIISAMSSSFTMLLICRFFVGFGVAGGIIPFDLLAEFSTDATRGKVLAATGAFWSLGTLLVASMAWLVVDSWGWRGLTGLCAIPLVLAILLVPYLAESPRWLADQGRESEALQVLREVARKNNTIQNFDTKPNIKIVTQLNGSSPSEEVSNANEDPTNSASIRSLFGPKFISRTRTLAILWFGFAFSYYGVVLFNPRVFKAPEGSLFNYEALMMSTVAESMGVIVTYLVIDRIGRRRTIATFNILCGLTLFALGLVVSSESRVYNLEVLFSVLSRCSIVVVCSSVWLTTPEQYPTHIRATGHGLHSSLSRFGGLLTPFLADSESLSIMFVTSIYSIVLLICGFTALQLPRNKSPSKVHEKQNSDKIVKTRQSNSVSHQSPPSELVEREPPSSPRALDWSVRVNRILQKRGGFKMLSMDMDDKITEQTKSSSPVSL